MIKGSHQEAEQRHSMTSNDFPGIPVPRCVDLLIVDNMTFESPVDFSPLGWQNLMQNLAANVGPGLAVEVWPSNAQSWVKGPMVKQWLR